MIMVYMAICTSGLNFTYKEENKYYSELRELNHGVSQCSVLGALLFLIYINELNIYIFF